VRTGDANGSTGNAVNWIPDDGDVFSVYGCIDTSLIITVFIVNTFGKLVPNYISQLHSFILL